MPTTSAALGPNSGSVLMHQLRSPLQLYLVLAKDPPQHGRR